VLYGNSNTHPEKYSSLCPKVGDALGDVAGPIAEATVQPLLVLATDAIADSVCHDKLEPLIQSYAHKGDWDEYEVFVNPISLLPVVQIWYRHGLRHVRSVPGWMPDNRRFNDLLVGLQGRDHNTKRDFTISQGKLPDQFKFLLDPVNDVINQGQKKYMDGTFDTFDIKDSLPAHGDVYVGLQGHEFWTDPGQDNWWHLWKKAGIVTRHDTSGSNTYASGCPEPCATPPTRIQNMGEIPFFIRIFEQDFFDPSIAVNSSFLARYSGHMASREAIMHNAGLTFQWPMYRHLRVDASGIFHIPDFSTDGAKRNLKMYPSGSFANPLLTLADAAKRLKDQSRTPEAPGSFIFPFTYVTLEAGHYPEAGHLPLVIDHPAILKSAGGNVVIGR